MLACSAEASVAGLWKAKKFFGPDARGPVVIQKTGDAYWADMAGEVVPS